MAAEKQNKMGHAKVTQKKPSCPKCSKELNAVKYYSPTGKSQGMWWQCSCGFSAKII